MPNALSQFKFQRKAVRTAIINDDICFCLADVCDCLELQNSTHTANQIKDEFELPTLNVGSFDTGFGIKELTLITEPQLYFVMMRSRSAIARAFRKWICEEVLPAIRKTGSYSVSISKAQQGELATLIAERFPSGKDRPYAWSRFNNHFRLASYKDLSANRFEEACEYIKQMPELAPALSKPETRSSINLFDPDEFMRVREIACKYLEDVAEKARGGHVTPSLEIPDNVLAGIVAMQMWKNNFTLGFNHEGKATIWKTPDPFDTVARIIADPGWANLEKIRKVFNACMNALTQRLGFGGTK